VSGEHDISTSRELDVAIQQAVDGGRGVIVDLADATFIDSTILRTLVNGHRAATALGVAGLTVVAPPGSVAAQLFELVHASEVLAISPSRDVAAERYGSGGAGCCAFPGCAAAGFVRENDLALCPAHRELLLSDPGEFRRLWGALDPRRVVTPQHEPGRPASPLSPAPES
jgi:anti-anti-sigma regulatory factor